MGKHKVIISLILFGTLLVILLFLNWVSFSQQKLTLYDPDSYHPYGLKALCLLLEKSDYRITVSQKIPDNRNQLVIVITNGKISGNNRKYLLNWVKSGGTIIELARDSLTLLPPGSGLKIGYLQVSSGKKFTSTLDFLGDLPYYIKHIPTIIIQNPQQGFYGSKEGFFIAAQPYGQGSLLFWNDLDGLTNQVVKEHPDNAVILPVLLKNLFPTIKTITIFQMPLPAKQYTANFNLTPMFNRYWGAFFLFGLGITLLLWKMGARFGRPIPLSLTPGRSYQEFVVSMAGLFQQANIQKLVLENLYQGLWNVIIEITGCLPDSAVTELTSRLNTITGRNYQDLIELHNKINNLPKRLSKRQFIEFAAKLDTYRKELLEWKKSR